MMQTSQILVCNLWLLRGLRGRGVGDAASAINMVTTPSHWITDLNVCVDVATQEPPEVDLTWLLRRPFSFPPPLTCQD